MDIILQQIISKKSNSLVNLPTKIEWIHKKFNNNAVNIILFEGFSI